MVAATALVDALAESMPADFTAKIQQGRIVIEVRRSWWMVAARVRLVPMAES